MCFLKCNSLSVILLSSLPNPSYHLDSTVSREILQIETLCVTVYGKATAQMAEIPKSIGLSKDEQPPSLTMLL